MDFVRIERRRQIQNSTPPLLCARSAQCGEWLSLAMIYKSHWRYVLSQAQFITHSREAAEEIAQDVFAFVWQHGQSYDWSRSSLPTWLSMLCRSRAIDYLRSQRNSLRALEYGVKLGLISDTRPGPEAQLISSSLRGAIGIALGMLPKHQRQLLIMHYYSELSHTEIAALTDLPLGTVKTTIRKAKIALGENPTLCDFQHNK